MGSTNEDMTILGLNRLNYISKQTSTITRVVDPMAVFPNGPDRLKGAPLALGGSTVAR